MATLTSGRWLSLCEQSTIQLSQCAKEITLSSASQQQQRIQQQKFEDIKQNIKRLTDALAQHKQTKQIAQPEVKRRQQLLDKLASDHKSMKSKVAKSKSATASASTASVGTPFSSATNALASRTSIDEDDYKQEQSQSGTRSESTTSNAQLLTQQQSSLTAQDAALDSILAGVTRLKFMSHDINSELSAHSHLLSDIESGMESSSAGIRQQTRSMADLDAAESRCSCCGVCTIAMLSVIIVLLLTTNVFCHIFRPKSC